MAYHHKITADEIRNKLEKRIREDEAELKALKGVTINTKLKTLSNRAISGEGAKIINYMDIDKALSVSYAVKHSNGGIAYKNRTITAYSYTDLEGNEIGVDGCLRISRTITPAELVLVVRDIVEALASDVGNLKSEYKRAESIAKKQNALVDKINVFNEGLSYASGAQI